MEHVFDYQAHGEHLSEKNSLLVLWIHSIMLMSQRFGSKNTNGQFMGMEKSFSIEALSLLLDTSENQKW